MSFTRPNYPYNTFDDHTPTHVADRVNLLMGDGLGKDMLIREKPKGKPDEFVFAGGCWTRKDGFAMGSKRVSAPAKGANGVIGWTWEDGWFVAHNFQGKWGGGRFIGAALEIGSYWNGGLWCGTQNFAYWKGGLMCPVPGKERACTPTWVPGHRTLYIGQIPEDNYRKFAEGAEKGLLVQYSLLSREFRLIHGLDPKTKLLDHTTFGDVGQRQCEELAINLHLMVKQDYAKRPGFCRTVENLQFYALDEASAVSGIDFTAPAGDADPYYRFMQLFHK